MTKTIQTNYGRIFITIEGKNVSISSTLKEDLIYSDKDPVNNFIDGIESFLIALLSNGKDIEDETIAKSVNDAIEAFLNNE